MNFRFLTSRPGLSFLMLVFLLVLTQSCSNTRDTRFSRTFHNLSARYNGYYNAGLKVQEGQEKLAASHEDKYDRILSVFQYANADKSKAIYSYMDDAMKRLSVVIQRHTIVDKRGNEKPNSEKWIDDNWLLYGKALFFKHDYFEAIEAFKYVEATYKKEPTRHLGSMWLAKTYIELTQMREAESKLDYLRNQKDFPKKNRWELAAVNADYHLQTKNFEKAIEHLTIAAELAPKKAQRSRFTFILAQLYQHQENYQKAFALYSKVLKMNPKDEMLFNARLNRARCFDANSKGAETVRQELAKMEKDPKNKDFLDQIYYALAGLADKEGKEAEEMELLNRSLRASVGNQNQKALSYLALAKIYFERPEYKPAQAYYDSTIGSLATDHPDYTEILSKRNSLTRLIKHLNTISHEDSLQALAKLSPEALEKLVADKIKAEEEASKKPEVNPDEQSNQIFSPARQTEINQFNRGTGANWYFYNPQAISFGYNEFTKKWGNRKLEDNWRRSDKQSVAPGLEPEPDEGEPDPGTGDDPATATKESKDPKAVAQKKKEDYLKIVPSTPAALEKSTTKIIDAYYNAAMIYREQLNDPAAAASMFETLMQRFPDCKYALQSYYQLYRIYSQQGNSAKAEIYKNIILTRYADTDYAEIIRNPDYAKTLAGKKSNLELFYEETYHKYLSGDYATVIQRRSQAELMFPQNALMPKFDLLRTLSIGRTQSVQQFEASLQDIIRTYQGDPVRDEAQNILDYLRSASGKTPSVAPAPAAPVSDSLTNKRTYVYSPDTTHYVIIVFQAIGGPIDGNKLRAKISDFNGRSYSNKQLSLQDLQFDHRDKMIVIKSFPNKAAALSYNSHLYNNDEVFGNTNPDDYQQVVVSINNFPELLKQKNLQTYEDFYRPFYR